MTTENPSELIASVEAALDKKAENLVVLDLRGLSDIADYFVICHGSSDRQVMAIADSIEDQLKRNFELLPNSLEGRRNGEWILMDYIDFVVHIFVEDKRDFYRLERLWGDAPRVDWAEAIGGDAQKLQSPTG